MRFVDHAGVRIATEAFGQPGDPALVLVMGATASMLGWPDALCTALAATGLHVIRFDHRDTGQSTSVPPGKARYAVEDMAGDVMAVLDGWGLKQAHLAGMSLGGYIAQMVALQHPQRVPSLTLIGSEPLGWDGPALPQISAAFLDHFGALATLDWADPAAIAAFLLQTERLCAGPVPAFEPAPAQARIARVLARTPSPASMFNHAALSLREDWTGRFRQIACPVLVLHGEHDPILPPENGRAIAAGIPGATFVLVAGIGHDLPPARLPDIACRIAQHVGQG